MRPVVTRSRFSLPALLAWLMLSLLGGCGGGEQESGLDETVTDFPIAYVKRPLALDEETGQPVEVDVRDPLLFQAGGDLYLRERASPSAGEIDITGAVTGGRGDVRDVSVSFDGTRLLFALRLPEIEDADPEDQPTWNIWEYDIPSATLRRVIASDILAEAGQDVAPAYLTDGRIVFVSTRQRNTRRILLEEGRPQFTPLNEDRNAPALTLHVMSPDGDDIEQITYNPSLDFDPVVMSDGRIVFSRWDNGAGRDAVSLYRVNPDGTGLEALFGTHSHDGEEQPNLYQFVAPKPFPDGRLLAVVRPQQSRWGGMPVLIDIENFADSAAPLPREGGTQAFEPVTRYDVRVEEGLSPGGRFSAIEPLWDGTERVLIAWAPCRVVVAGRLRVCDEAALADESAEPALPRFGIYIYDVATDTQLPVVLPREGIVYSELVAARPRDYLLNIGSGRDDTLAAEAVGLLKIRSVYDLDGALDLDLDRRTSDAVTLGGVPVATLDELADPALVPASARPARFLRIVKGVALPDDDIKEIDNAAFGVSRAQLMREIVGYAPIEPDGSVAVKVPADVPLMVSIVDGEGRRVGPRHNAWIQLRPGETLQCNGCHDHASGAPHARAGALEPVNTGAAGGAPFPNTNPAWVAAAGETMAETRLRHQCGGALGANDCPDLAPSLDLRFDDLWPDPAVVAPEPSFAYLYADLTTPSPATFQCQPSWSARCRAVINYPDHIHPLWSAPRPVPNGLGGTVEGACIDCHSPSDGINPRVPAGQLDLSDDFDDGLTDIRRKAYDELLRTDNEQEVVDGVLQDRLVEQIIEVERQAVDAYGDPLFETDAEGNLILDGDGNPIPVIEIVQETILVPVPVRPSMSARAARNAYFLEKMTGRELSAGRSLADDPNTVDHTVMMSAAELKLISEWLDIGAQYYNDPFAAPSPN